MTARQVQDALWIWLRQKGHEWMCPNYTPPDWWECDMFSLTKSGRFVEHEIKLSLADFRKDAKKQKDEWNGKWGAEYGRITDKKHDLLLGSHASGPTRFFYVAPRDMIPLDLIPHWAGLLTFTHPKGAYNGFSFFREKDAPKLHDDVFPEKTIASLGQTFYWRFWSAKRAVRDPGGVNDYDI